MAGETGERGRKCSAGRVGLLMAALAVAVGLIGLGCYYLRGRAEYVPPPLAYDGSASGLKQTAVVATLDTPAPKGRNAIWCGSFQLAWNRLRAEVIGEPVRVRNAEDVAARLNAATFADADLPAGSFYAAAGKVSDGITQTIRSEMAKRFPGVDPPTFGDPGSDGLVAYAYLKAAAKFTVPYFDRPGGDAFTDSTGRKTQVRTFGLFKTGSEVEINDRLAEQIEVLYCKVDEETHRLREFALDLCRTSQPNQLIVACVEPGASLAETLAGLDAKIAAWAPEDRRGFTSHDTLAVPVLHWKISHRFRELEGADKVLDNPRWSGYWIARAHQTIEFRLDRSGAAVASESNVYAAAMPRNYLFTRPFLIVMKKRGTAAPFFVMWVDNAELLCRQDG